MSVVPVSEARAALPELLDRVLAGEEVTITRHGQAVAVLVRPDALRVRRADQAIADAERLRILIDAARETALSRQGELGQQGEISPERAEVLVADVAASRSDR